MKELAQRRAPMIGPAKAGSVVVPVAVPVMKLRVPLLVEPFELGALNAPVKGLVTVNAQACVLPVLLSKQVAVLVPLMTKRVPTLNANGVLAARKSQVPW